METLKDAFAPTEEQQGVDTVKAERKAFIKSLKTDLQEKISSDPEYAQRLRSLSNSLRVVNTLGYGTGGNIKLDENSADRKLVATSQIVGYVVENIGTEPITYKTEVWAEVDGKYVATASDKVLAPGDKVALTRKFMTVLCSRTEISFVLENGKIITKLGKNKTVESMLNSCFFQFNDDTTVNDDSVKISVDEVGPDGARHVKPEFIEAFGYLNNPKEKAASRGTKSKVNVTVQDMMANYINQQISQNE